MLRETLTTPDGTFVLWFSERGLAAVDFPGRAGRRMADPAPPPPASMRRWIAQARRAIVQVLDGRRPKSWPPLDLRAGTPFQQAVWKVLHRIPAGRTMSYAEVARAVGKPGAARAVGQACGANPIPLLIPCHRVLAANRRIGGFSGGLEWKRRLLEREGVTDLASARAGRVAGGGRAGRQ